MKIDINTKFNIGDTVYAFLSKWNAESNYHDCEYRMELYQKKIIAIRYYENNEGEKKIQYFLEGLTSYEGENWFTEPNDGDWKPYYCEERIFLSENDAYKAYNYYKYLMAYDKIFDKVESLLTNYNQDNYIK